jgi:predicted chitinase
MNQQFFMGIVENRTGDPLKLGRCQVRVFGVHTESLDDVPTSALPWAIPLMPATSASLSGIGHSVTQYVEGTMVFLFFQDGESKQQPIILGSAAGVPMNKSPFPTKGMYQIESAIDLSQPPESTPKSLPTPVKSSDGTPVTDSSGTPIQTDAPKTGLDISKMVSAYGSNVTTMYQTLRDFGIRDDYACAAILANIAKECKFKLVRESMVYSTIARIRAVFSSKVKGMSDDEVQHYVNNQEALANLVYANSDGNGNPNSGDGFKYRGGGFIQLTKKNNYKSVGEKIGVDLINSPDQIINSSVAPKAAAQYFINRFGGANKLVFSSLDDALTTITKKVNPGGFAMDFPKVKEISKLFTINVDPDEIAKKEAAAETKSPNNPENDVDKNATQQQIDSGTTAKTSFTPNLGFKDPNSKYPLTSMLKEADSNRLARRSTEGTSIDVRTRNRRTAIRSVDGTFSEPTPAYNAQYPFNHVYATEAGHVMEFDDTPGSERISTFHSSGTYSEVDKFGNKTNKIIGDSFSIIERNGYVFIDGTVRITIGGDAKLVVGGNLDAEVDGNLNFDVGGDLTMKVGGSLKIGTGSGISAQSGGAVGIDGSQIHLNSQTSEAITPNARGGTSMDYTTQVPESFSGSTSLKIEEGSEGDVSDYINSQIDIGVVTKKEVDDGKTASEKPEKVDEKPAETTQPELPVSCSIFANKTDIPDNTQVSKYYTIGMLSTKALAGGHKITAQRNLSVPEIACNLKKVAQNCLDVIKTKYPQMVVTSGFRRGGATSQHELGEAIDMQFNVPNSEYFAIAQWIKDNVLFDKLLLEYKTIESGKAWIHISYKDSPRKEVYTYMNHSKSGNGLRKLQ